VGIELEGLVLVVDEYAGQIDLHGMTVSFPGGRVKIQRD
jgi:hypothetical protein